MRSTFNTGLTHDVGHSEYLGDSDDDTNMSHTALAVSY